jgi:rubredoxin
MLPGGLALADGRVLRRAALRELTGREEEWLAASAGVPAAPLTSRLLAACLAGLDGEPGGRELAGRLLVGDRDFLVLELRRMTFGPHVAAVLNCPACGAKMDLDFELDAVPVEPRPQAPAFSAPVEQERGPPREVRFRLPTGADQEAVLGLEPEAAAAALLERCLLDAPPGGLTYEQQAAVGAAMERLAPRVEIDLDLRCPECGAEFGAPFDLTAFFYAELRATSRLLLREVHSLALYYHWGEAEILGLTRAKRRAYLELLSG